MGSIGLEIFPGDKMSRRIQLVSPFGGLKEETVETAASEEFQISEYQVGHPQSLPNFSSITSSDKKWYSCSNEDGETCMVEDPESAEPIYAASLLDLSTLEHQGAQNEMKVEKNSLSLSESDTYFLDQEISQGESKVEDFHRQ